MKRLFLWIVMVLLMVALLLGGAGAALYAMTGENRLPDTHPTLGEVALEPNGSDWSVPVLGQYQPHGAKTRRFWRCSARAGFA